MVAFESNKKKTLLLYNLKILNRIGVEDVRTSKKQCDRKGKEADKIIWDV